MDTSELQGLTVKELQKFAGDLGSTEFSGLRKHCSRTWFSDLSNYNHSNV